METKKDIGAAVKHRLEPFKDSPDDIVWSNIEAQLKKKKKRRGIIFWFSGAGFTALLLLMLLINPFNNSIENNIPETEIQTVNSSNNSTNKQSTIPKNKINSDSKNSTKPGININLEESSVDIVAKEQSISKTNTTKALERSNLKSEKDQISNSNNNHTPRLNAQPKVAISKISDIPNITSDKDEDEDEDENVKELTNDNTSAITKNEKRSTRAIAIAKRDSLIASNKKIRDSIKEERQSKRLVSEEEIEEKIKDSITEDDQSRWSITPQAILSYYGALNTKTTDNFSVNYGVLASYRMTEDTYLRIGVRKLNLNQTLDADGTERLVEYLEFPLEVKYTPRDHKVNPFVIGGLSYFKLQDGSNNNSNNFEYRATMSLNLGLGLETKLFKDVYFNIESIFNYQVKPFTQKNNVEPFIFSINTGIEYRF